MLIYTYMQVLESCYYWEKNYLTSILDFANQIYIDW